MCLVIVKKIKKKKNSDLILLGDTRHAHTASTLNVHGTV